MTNPFLPNKDACEIADSKILNYLLSETHEEGRHKSKYFSAFGFSAEGWISFRAALIQHPGRNPVSKTFVSEYGRKFIVTCSIETPDGRNPCIVTVWYDDGGGIPKLATAFPK